MLTRFLGSLNVYKFGVSLADFYMGFYALQTCSQYCKWRSINYTVFSNISFEALLIIADKLISKYQDRKIELMKEYM